MRSGPRMSRLVAVVLGGALCWNGGVVTAQVNCSYTGPDGGNWNNAANWACGIVPNNGNGGNDYIVTLDLPGSNTVVYDTFGRVNALTVGAGEQLSIPNDRDLGITVGPVNNAGVILLNSSGNDTDLQVLAPTLTLSGAGTLRMSSAIQNRVYGVGGTRRLLNASDHTIAGTGQIGVNVNLFLTNDGLIQADQTTALVIDLSGAADDNVNNGTLQAAAGGTLYLLNTGLDNGAGRIRAADTSIVLVEGSHILGGELTTVGSGRLQLSNGASTFEDVTNTGLLVFPNDRDAFFNGTITNDATISMEATVNDTDFVIASDVTLAGGGMLAMSNAGTNRLFGSGATRRLLNGATHTIRGSGQIGVNVNLNLTNEGLIQADQSAALVIDLSGAATSNFNNATMQAASGGTLHFAGTALDNSSGVIAALDASVVRFEGTQIVGGELTSAGSGRLQLFNGASAFEDVTNTGVLVFPNDRDATFRGTITNDATISMEATVNDTDFVIASDVTLAGGGMLAMSNAGTNRLFGSGATRRLTNGATHAIRGSGQIGVNVNLNLTNEGLIQADQSAALVVDLSGAASSNFNNATMQAASGGTLRLAGTALDNSSGIIAARDASVVTFEGTEIVGGELTSAGSGRMQLSNAASAFEDVTNTGLLVFPNDRDAFFRGTITNDATISMEATSNDTDFVIASDVTLAGSGTLAMSNAGTNRLFGSGGTRRLTNGATHTIRGSGQIGVNVNLNLTNEGLIQADQSSPLAIDVSSDFTNHGSIRVSSAATLNIAPGAFATDGAVSIDAACALNRSGDYVQTGGSTDVRGTLAISAGQLRLQGGSLAGTGTVSGSVNNTGGVARPGAAVGALSVTGSYSQAVGGQLSIELSGIAAGQFDVLNVGGSATLAGAIEAVAVGSYVPQVGDRFVILNAASVSGNFTTRGVVGFPSDLGIRVVTSPTTAMLVVVRTGDLNCDGVVNNFDINPFVLALTDTGGYEAAFPNCEYYNADMNGDGLVNNFDIDPFVDCLSSGLCE